MMGVFQSSLLLFSSFNPDSFVICLSTHTPLPESKMLNMFTFLNFSDLFTLFCRCFYNLCLTLFTRSNIKIKISSIKRIRNKTLCQQHQVELFVDSNSDRIWREEEMNVEFLCAVYDCHWHTSNQQA